MSGTRATGAARPEGEEGQIGLLILGVCVLVLTLVIGVVDVTAIQLARVRLYDASDAAALDAADAIFEGGAYRDGVRERLPVTDESVRAAAQRYLATTDRPDRLTSWQIGAGTGTADGRSATVALTGTVEAPIGGGLLADVFGPIRLTVTSRADGRVEAPVGARP